MSKKKRKKNTKLKCQKKIQKDQKGIFTLWCQGSFALFQYSFDLGFLPQGLYKQSFSVTMQDGDHADETKCSNPGHWRPSAWHPVQLSGWDVSQGGGSGANIRLIKCANCPPQGEWLFSPKASRITQPRDGRSGGELEFSIKKIKRQIPNSIFRRQGRPPAFPGLHRHPPDDPLGAPAHHSLLPHNCSHPSHYKFPFKTLVHKIFQELRMLSSALKCEVTVITKVCCSQLLEIFYRKHVTRKYHVVPVRGSPEKQLIKCCSEWRYCFNIWPNSSFRAVVLQHRSCGETPGQTTKTYSEYGVTQNLCCWLENTL